MVLGLDQVRLGVKMGEYFITDITEHYYSSTDELPLYILMRICSVLWQQDRLLRD